MRKVICKDSGDYRLFLTKSTYTNGRLYLGLEWYDENEDSYELWDDITINLADYMIEDDNIVFISEYLPTDTYLDLIDLGLLIEIEPIHYNMGVYMKCYVNMDLVDEYTKGMEV